MVKEFNRLPVYEAIMTDDALGIFTIALVDHPAMEVDMQFFSAVEPEKEVMKYSIINEEEHRVIAPIIRADFPILRRNEEGEKFYVMFSKDTIYEAAKRFLENGFQGLVKLTHNPEAEMIDGFSLVQWFIKDTEKGIAPAGFEDVADGSLFAEYKVSNEAVWSAIKEHTFNGLSMESVFVLAEPQEEEITSVEQLLEQLGIA